MIRRLLTLFTVAFALTVTPVAAAPQDPPEAAADPWSVELRVHRYLNSHTSYEFGNPFPPGQAPLSRLEFPLNSSWAGVDVRRRISRFSVGVEALTNLSGEADGVMKDSDWDDDAKPTVMTIYSESRCRLERSYRLRGDLDMKVSDWLGLPSRLALRPVVGFRWQRLNFMVHDGWQTEVGVGTDALPGDSIRFDQTYWQYFVGLKGALDLGRLGKRMPLKLHGQVDWAYVEGSNQDHHLLRVGNRFTYERTYGDAWHAALGLKIGLTESLQAGVEVDHVRIQTTGTHRLENSAFLISESWDHGVRVWSEQTNVNVGLEYRF